MGFKEEAAEDRAKALKLAREEAEAANLSDEVLWAQLLVRWQWREGIGVGRWDDERNDELLSRILGLDAKTQELVPKTLWGVPRKIWQQVPSLEEPSLVSLPANSIALGTAESFLFLLETSPDTPVAIRRLAKAYQTPEEREFALEFIRRLEKEKGSLWGPLGLLEFARAKAILGAREGATEVAKTWTERIANPDFAEELTHEYEIQDLLISLSQLWFELGEEGYAKQILERLQKYRPRDDVDEGEAFDWEVRRASTPLLNLEAIQNQVPLLRNGGLFIANEAYIDIVKEILKKGDFKLAEEFIDQMGIPSYRARALAFLVFAWVSQGHLWDAEWAVDELKRILEREKNRSSPSQNYIFYSQVAYGAGLLAIGRRAEGYTQLHEAFNLALHNEFLRSGYWGRVHVLRGVDILAEAARLQKSQVVVPAFQTIFSQWIGEEDLKKHSIIEGLLKAFSDPQGHLGMLKGRALDSLSWQLFERWLQLKKIWNPEIAAQLSKLKSQEWPEAQTGTSVVRQRISQFIDLFNSNVAPKLGRDSYLLVLPFMLDSRSPELTPGGWELAVTLVSEMLVQGRDQASIEEALKERILNSIFILEEITGKSQGLLSIEAKIQEAPEIKEIDRVKPSTPEPQVYVFQPSGKERVEFTAHPSTYFVLTELLKKWEERGILKPNDIYLLSVKTRLGNEGIRIFIPSFFAGYPEEKFVGLPLLSTLFDRPGFPSLSEDSEKGLSFYQRPLGLPLEEGKLHRLYPADIERSLLLIQGVALIAEKHSLDNVPLQQGIVKYYRHLVDQLNDFYRTQLNLAEDHIQALNGNGYQGSRSPYPDGEIQGRIRFLREQGILQHRQALEEVFSEYVASLRTLLYPQGSLSRELVELLEKNSLQFGDIYSYVKTLADHNHSEAKELLAKTKSARAEVRKIEKAMSARFDRREAANRFQEKYAVVVDMNVFDALSEEQQIEFKKQIHARSEVRFVFNVAGERRLDPALQELMDFRGRYKNVEIRIDPTSFDFQGRKVINISKEGVQSHYADFLERRLSQSKDLYRVRYREGGREAGLLTAALLLLESRPEEFIRQGRYFSEVPRALRSHVDQFLLAYVYVGRSA